MVTGVFALWSSGGDPAAWYPEEAHSTCITAYPDTTFSNLGVLGPGVQSNDKPENMRSV
jgi:hypothetical protein